jgi:hypothetical protein
VIKLATPSPTQGKKMHRQSYMADLRVRIKEASAGRSYERVAKDCGLARATVTNLSSPCSQRFPEKGPHMWTLLQLAQGLGVDSRWLIFGDE